MRYLVKARLKPGMHASLADAIESETLGAGSVAGREYLRNMAAARLLRDGTVTWVEVCYCPTPLEEERPYWEDFFDLLDVRNAHARDRCHDLDGSEPWACGSCDCTDRLEAHLSGKGVAFRPMLLDEPPTTCRP